MFQACSLTVDLVLDRKSIVVTAHPRLNWVSLRWGVTTASCNLASTTVFPFKVVDFSIGYR